MKGRNKNKNIAGKLILSITLILFSIILSLQTFAAKDFIVENKNPENQNYELTSAELSQIAKFETEAAQIEATVTPKALMALSPGFYQAPGEFISQKISREDLKPIIESLGYQKINGSIIMRLG